MRQIIFTLGLVGLVNFVVSAQQPNSLQVRSSNNSEIMIRLDHRYLNQQGVNILVYDIVPGRHRLKIFRASPLGFSKKALVYDQYFTAIPGRVTDVLVDVVTRSAEINFMEPDSRSIGHTPSDPLDRSKHQK
ncbi:MAG: hypothetical protein JST52_05705 [Bacteroidetes bacterium]|nr:hypothetical protein [Bacteroidota bacterium]MBS1739754.1 hypothetical protein [Bacteroidota bacterium]MBS1776711.1 hypothetical protein [Bacteroidota bacterium]